MTTTATTLTFDVPTMDGGPERAGSVSGMGDMPTMGTSSVMQRPKSGLNGLNGLAHSDAAGALMIAVIVMAMANDFRKARNQALMASLARPKPVASAEDERRAFIAKYGSPAQRQEVMA